MAAEIAVVPSQPRPGLRASMRPRRMAAEIAVDARGPAELNQLQ